MEMTSFAQGISILATLAFLVLAKYTRKKYHSLEDRSSINSDVYLYQYLFYYSASILLSSLACITAFVLMIIQIYYALN